MMVLEVGYPDPGYPNIVTSSPSKTKTPISAVFYRPSRALPQISLVPYCLSVPGSPLYPQDTVWRIVPTPEPPPSSVSFLGAAWVFLRPWPSEAVLDERPRHCAPWLPDAGTPWLPGCGLSPWRSLRMLPHLEVARCGVEPPQPLLFVNRC